MKVLMLSCEMFPYAKTGGLADMVRSLCDALYASGHDVRLMIPEYSITPGRLKVAEGCIPLGFSPLAYRIHQLSIGTVFSVLAVDVPALFHREGIYGDDGQSEYPDNTKRFALLYRAALQTCVRLNWVPDIIHSHDWHTAPVMAYRKKCYPERIAASQGGILTIHNFGYRGFFPVHDIHYTGLERGDFQAGDSIPDTFSFLLSGLRHADRITAVSPTYAGEISRGGSDEFGEVLGERSDPVVGILNGMDYDLWNPRTDRFLPARFSRDNLAGKRACKAGLQRELGLPVDPARPLIGMVTRLARQKGIEELLKPGYGCLERICRELPVQVAFLGAGEHWAGEELKRLNETYGNISVTIGFSEEIAHRIEAASDFFLMPSRYEPCGLNQMYSLAYASLPIVSRTGGLADTVEQYDSASGSGTGFFIDGTTPDAIFDAVKTAEQVWANWRPHIEQMRRTAMGRRFTWETAANSYEQVYESALR